MSVNYFCKVLFVTLFVTLIECRNYNTGLIFYDLKSLRAYLPPTVSVSRGRAINNVQYSSKGSIWSTFGKPCECEGLLCGCCAGLKVNQFNFDQKMCANITYAPQRNQLHLEVFFNEKPASRYGISARNPSPLCIPIMMTIPMAMCVQMSNIAIEGNNLNMCMDFVVRLASADLFEMHFQCMRMGLDGVQYVDKDGKPVIPMNGGGGGSIKKTNSNDYEEYYDDTAVNILPIQPDDNERDEDESDNEIDSNDSETDIDNDENDNDSASESENESDSEENEMILVSKETNEVPKPITSAIILEYTDEPTTTSLVDDNEYQFEAEVETEETQTEEEAVIETVTKLVTELNALETTTNGLIEVPTTTTTITSATKEQVENVTQNAVSMSNLEQNSMKTTNDSLSVSEQVTKVAEARRLKKHSKNMLYFYKNLFSFL